MKTVLDVLLASESFLKERGIDRPRREAEEVIANTLGMHRIDLYLQFDRPLTEEELCRLRIVIKKRAEGIPAAYISGTVQFADLTLRITPDVLIPRPETEILVEKISDVLKTQDLHGKVLWDVCCGSGCIGHALKKRFPSLRVILSDLSEKALAVARENGNDVEFKLGDLLTPFKNEKCDFFVCNPPYVTEEEYAHLSVEVKAEPKCALVGGLVFYERLAARLPFHMNQGGLAWMEIGTGQGEAVKKIFDGKGSVEKDWAGHDRFFFLESLIAT